MTPLGARGDGRADDTAAIQAAIDGLPAAGGSVFLPAGEYRITAPLRIVDDATGGYRRGVVFAGAGGGASGGSTASRLRWDGADEHAMLQLHSRDCVVSHLSFSVAAGRRAAAAIDVDQAPAHTTTCTNNTFQHLFITQGRGRMRHGVRIGATALANAELMGFSDCHFASIEDACVSIPSRTGQSKAHRFYKCAFAFSRFGIFQETGSFVTFGCSFGYLTEAAVRLNSITDYIAVNETDSEGCARFLSTGGGTSASWAVKIDGARLALNGLAPDGRYIDFTDGGPLLIQNVLFGDVYNPAFKIRVASAEPGAVLIAFGNVFPNDTPFDTVGRRRLIALGNRGYRPAGGPVNLDDEFMVQGGAGGGVSLATVRSISATSHKGKNLRGAVTLTDTTSAAPVAFAANEPDAAYYVVASVSGITGRPDPGSTRVHAEQKGAKGFMVVAESPPGPGNSVTVDWIVLR